MASLPLVLRGLAACCLAVWSVAAAAPAQEASRWNTARALELVDRAVEQRLLRQADEELAHYQAKAHGHIYFFVDRLDVDERILVKADQIALEVYWSAPNLTRQRIVGLRESSRLPNRMHYHLDHLVVVQDEFGDVIRLGDGDEVGDVPHPASAYGRQVYDYRLADSLTLRLPGAPEPVRVYEVEVRPRDTAQPGFVGALYLDRANAQIARMTFTFTPASYVDRRLEYIQVSLENGLWQGRFWLPYEQRLEIRRQLPELDIPAATVIRGVMRIGDYEFDRPVPREFFLAPAITAVPAAARAEYTFPTGLYAGLEDEGLLRRPELERLGRQAAALLERRSLSALPRFRFHVPGASAVLRYNRAEGALVGGGIAFLPSPALRLQAWTGYAAGARHLAMSGGATLKPTGQTRIRIAAERYALRDMGLRAGAPGTVNTLLAGTVGEDRTDPYYAHGLVLEATHHPAGPWRIRGAVLAQRHRAARLTAHASLFADSSAFRPVRPADEGRLTAVGLALRRLDPGPVAISWRGEIGAELGDFAGETFARSMAELAVTRRSEGRGASAELRGAAGMIWGEAPVQRLFLLGGAATLPGYPYRGFGGDRFVLGELELGADILAPWLRVRATAAAGWTAFSAAEPPAAQDLPATDGARTSAGLGLGLFYDLARLDLSRGLNGGGWRLVFTVDPRLNEIL